MNGLLYLFAFGGQLIYYQTKVMVSANMFIPQKHLAKLTKGHSDF